MNRFASEREPGAEVSNELVERIVSYVSDNRKSLGRIPGTTIQYMLKKACDALHITDPKKISAVKREAARHLTKTGARKEKPVLKKTAPVDKDPWSRSARNNPLNGYQPDN